MPPSKRLGGLTGPRPVPAMQVSLNGRVAVLGIGNRLWGDDGAGSMLAERLAAAHPQAAVFDGGMVPENYLEKVLATHPDTVLLIDAADFGAAPGESRVFSGEELAMTGLSTHAGSPRMLAAYLEQRMPVEVKLLAIQPGAVAEGEGLSPEVEAGITALLERILAPCKRQVPP